MWEHRGRQSMKAFTTLRNQHGSVLVVSIILLLVFTVIGLYTLGSATVDVKISGNKRGYDVAFGAANGGLDYALATVPFSSMDWSNPSVAFASPPNAAVEFTGTVTYLGNTTPPVGSGTGTRVFRAHHYRVDSQGTDSSGIATTTVQAWGYRIGF
jgi:Tfp pilus assembly protein PilX